MNRVGILEYDKGDHYLTLTDSISNLKANLSADFVANKLSNDDAESDSIIDGLLNNYMGSVLNGPIAVIYNKSGVHYESPKYLAKLLFSY